MPKAKRIRGYLLFSLGFFLLWFLFKLGGMPDFGKAIASTLIDVVFSVGAMAVAVQLLLPRFIYTNRFTGFAVCFGGMILLAGSAIIFSQLTLMGSSVFAYQKNIAKYQEHYFYWFWSDLIFGSYILVAFLCLTGIAVRMTFDRIVSARQMEKLEKENAQAELLILKHQVNPHFIFNTLNTIYYKIDKTNPDARQILEHFSSLLRYQLYESNGPSVLVENELEFLRKYIMVQQQRFNQNCRIDIEGLENIKGFELAPYLLVPIVENCFKHVSAMKDGTSFIAVRGERQGSTFIFRTENSVNGTNNLNNAGIGIDNLRRRLELLYRDRYDFRAARDENVFRTCLIIEVL